MGDLQEAVEAHLKKFKAAPFLFVGAGFGRRYLNLDGWEALLRRFAEVAGNDYDFYYSDADGSVLRIASSIAEDLHRPFWIEERFAPVRERYKGRLKTRASGLKALVADYVSVSADDFPVDGDLGAELALLREAVVDGIITTNYDPLLETLFPEFEVFVGQDRLLFSEPRQVAEIYKIHGSYEDPDSLVLTASDYERFDKRNPYLAAKLLTIFVEHPIVFLGYSLNDPNITSILRSIATVLTNERVGQLQDRLIFVQWAEDVDEPVLTKTTVVADGYNIPVVTVTVSDFKGVFAALANLKRGFPAKLLRQLKEHVYELVLTNDPKGQLHVLPLEPGQDVRDVEVVFAVGAISRLRSYVGLTREDLITEILDDKAPAVDPSKLPPDTATHASRVVQETLPHVLTLPGNVPVFRYLRHAGLLDDAGDLLSKKTVPPKVAAHAASRATRLGVISSYRNRARREVTADTTLAKLIRDHEPHLALHLIPALNESGINPTRLRNFLLETRELGESSHSQWVKIVCFYDWLVYGRKNKPKRIGRRRRQES